MHDKIKFWMIEDFEKWLLTPEVQVANCRKEPYLEEENVDSTPADTSTHTRKATTPTIDLQDTSFLTSEIASTVNEKIVSGVTKEVVHVHEVKDTTTAAPTINKEAMPAVNEEAISGVTKEVTHGGENKIETMQVIDKTPVIPFSSPLNSLLQVATKLNIQIPEDISTSEPDQPKVATNNSPTTSSLSVPTQGSGAKKIMKIQPGPVYNGRNICVHHWLKQLKDATNGTMVEFKIYYESLRKEQQEAYDKEAVDLNAWNKDTFNGPML
ncbi:hypothetical protein J3R82DRAFT_7757 [Butyriboletus roseoflavus]|nr:hypothetical protein J3R82DRAFT_7757 [Butyriboletus roseoflavus]